MNTTSNIIRAVETEKSINWFAAQELDWGCFHYVAVAYVDSLNIVIGFIENLLILYVVYNLKYGVGTTARLYYALLAIFNFCNLLFLHLLNGEFTYGLNFATQGSFYLKETIYNEWFCKIYINLYIPIDVLVMWTYVLFNIERVLAIASPLKAKAFFSVRRNLMYIVIVAVLGVGLMIYCASVQEITYTLDVLGPIICLPVSESLAKMIIFQLLTNMAIFTLPPALSLFFGILLLVFIRRQMAVRFHLLGGLGGSSATSNASATTGCVVVITMAIVHAVINLPAGIIGCFYFMYRIL